VWQALYEELKDHGFVVIAVALDSREGDPLPWIEAAAPTYPCLIDRDHRLADLYHMVNVPEAVWIDERGTIVRPTEAAGAYEGFRRMDRVTREVPADVARLTADAKATYLDAIRDWVRRGEASEHALDPARAQARAPHTGSLYRPWPQLCIDVEGRGGDQCGDDRNDGVARHRDGGFMGQRPGDEDFGGEGLDEDA